MEKVCITKDKLLGDDPMDETAWLIEAPGPFYLSVTKAGGQHFSWRTDANDALRFCRKIDADNTMMAVRVLKPELFPPVFPIDPKPVEHAWVKP